MRYASLLLYDSKPCVNHANTIIGNKRDIEIMLLHACVVVMMTVTSLFLMTALFHLKIGAVLHDHS